MRADSRKEQNVLARQCAAALSEIAGIEARVELGRAGLELGFEGVLSLRTRRRSAPLELLIDVKRTHLSYGLVEGLLAQHRKTKSPWVLFAPYVAAPMGRFLAARNASYVDAVGNCHLLADGELLLHVEGHKPARSPSTRGAGRLASHQLALAVLARPELLAAKVRDVADAAGIGKSAVADQFARWTDQGLLARMTSGYQLVRPRDLLERWLGAYPEVVRPRWLIGRYRLADSTPDAIEALLAGALSDPWALGGASAAWRLNRHLQPDSVVVHVQALPTNALRRLRAIPSDEGQIIILKTPGAIAYEGPMPNVTHPLLAYTEMITSADARVRDAASLLREKFLTAFR